MLVSAAVKFQFRDGTELMVCGARHPYCYELFEDIKRLSPDIKNKEVTATVDGFIDDWNIFYDRYKAFEKAKEWHQLSTTTLVAKRDGLENELYSEDLY